MEKKVSDFLGGEIVSSVFYLAFGLCLILIPDQTVNIICKIIFGVVMIAAGLYHIVIYTAEKKKATILDLFTGVIVTVLGIFLFFTPQIVIKILPYLLGAFVLVDSIWKIKGSYRLKKAERGRWKALLIGCLIFIVLGVSLLFYSFLSVSKMILFSGIILTANGVADIVFLIMLRTGIRKTEKLRIAKEKEEAENIKEQNSENTSSELVSESTEKPKKKEAQYEKASTVPPDTSSDTQSDTPSDTVSEENHQDHQITEPDIKTAATGSADADVVLEKEQEAEDDVESPGREIREMLKNHDESLEEWKD